MIPKKARRNSPRPKLAEVASMPTEGPHTNKSLALTLLRSGEEPSSATLRTLGYATLEDMLQSVASLLKLPRLALDSVEIAPEATKLINRSLAERHHIVPVFASDEELTVATCDPTRIELFDWLAGELRREIITVVASLPEITRAIERSYSAGRLEISQDDEEESEEEISAEALMEAEPVVDRLIHGAIESRASDVHLEATQKGTCVRYRIDGMLREIEVLPAELHPAVVSRIKVMAQLDIAERAVPQDGRVKIRKPGGGEIDLRISTLPTYFGEKVCCRVLDNLRATLSLSEIGFEPDQLAIFERLIHAPYGMLLVTGPTASGKSTTLYSALNAVRSPELNIVTVEDPIEYQLPGINQVQVNPKRGLTFATALRAILRQDPNVVLVGEIRDQETGSIAAQAALTGHLVMASLHTNDAASAIVRLLDMGIQPYLVAPTIVGVVAQRLVRKICQNCREEYEPKLDELTALGLSELPRGAKFSRGRGCPSCQNSGYSSRTAVREILEVGDSLRRAISRGAQTEAIHEEAARQGFRSMRFQALKKLLAGITTAQEVIRLTRA